jgi:hypothetical protein
MMLPTTAREIRFLRAVAAPQPGTNPIVVERVGETIEDEYAVVADPAEVTTSDYLFVVFDALRTTGWTARAVSCLCMGRYGHQFVVVPPREVPLDDESSLPRIGSFDEDRGLHTENAGPPSRHLLERDATAGDQRARR